MHHDPPDFTRVLAVADWTLQPHPVVARLARYAETRPVAFGLVVPAWLHGLDWAGDPTASVPCAQRQLDTLSRLCGQAGLLVGAASVGDPDPVTATADALGAWPAAEILLYTRERRLALPVIDVASRLERATGLPVTRLPVAFPTPAGDRARSRRGHCTLVSARA
jgi:hypothetical protein